MKEEAWNTETNYLQEAQPSLTIQHTLNSSPFVKPDFLYRIDKNARHHLEPGESNPHYSVLIH
jgi:hypothetical protein